MIDDLTRSILEQRDNIENQRNREIKSNEKIIERTPQEVHDNIVKLLQENKQLKEELQKADSITQSCIFEGKEESTINFRECLNKLELYKEVIEEVRDVIDTYKYVENDDGMYEPILDGYDIQKLLQILDKVKGE